MTLDLPTPESLEIPEDQIEKLEREVIEGAQARSIMTDPIVEGALESIEARWIKAWRQTTPNQTEDREKAWGILRGLDDFKVELTKIVDRGTFATEMLTRAENGGAGST